MNASPDLLDDDTLDALPEARGPRGIQSIEVGGQLLLALAHHGRPMALKDLAREAAMSPAKAHPYLSFRGNTREAFAFYAQALGAEIQAMLRFADMPAPPAGDDGCAGGPPPGADGAGDGIMHACLALPGEKQRLMHCDL